MNPHAVRRLDSWLGKPMCFALTIVRRVVDLFRAPADFRQPPKKILLIKMS